MNAFSRRRKAHHGNPSDSDWGSWRSFAFVASLLLNAFLIFVVWKGFAEKDDVFVAGLDRSDFSLEALEVSLHGDEVAVSTRDTGEVARRMSSSSSSASSSSSSSCSDSSASSGAGGHGGHHQTDALLYLFNTLIAGAAVLQFTSRFPSFPLTVVLFAMGFGLSIFLKHADLIDKLRIWGDSWEMWMDIDPHLLLFTLLPALLAGDAMTIDPSVARRVYLQCLWLAGPGVLICGFCTAGFLKLFLGWDFWLCVCGGAILCATDPVAVVALLKELGASPVLTVQIQGESLLNDGTSIVLYLISNNILKGENYEWSDVADFLIKKAVMAWALGLFIGYAFFYWISYAGINKLDHNSSMIQITLTLCCAYWSFIFVEGVLLLSGVLATVASSLVLAKYMWPHICSPETMHHVWHTFESLGNIIIFFLAGSITGWIIGDIDWICYFHLIVIYIFLICLRFALMFASRPILKLLSYDRSPVTWQEAVVMSWGGLRGAVGLAMAISVNLERAPHKCTGDLAINQKDAECLLFYVSGVALLTMLINAVTAPKIVNKLGITAQSSDRRKLLKMFHQQLYHWSQEAAVAPDVKEAMKDMMMAAEEEIDHQKWKKKETGIVEAGGKQKGNYAFQSNDQAIAEWIEKKKIYEELIQKEFPDRVHDGAIHHLILGLDVAEEGKKALLGNVDDMIDLIKEQPVDEGMAKSVNEVFLKMLSHDYQHMVEDDWLPPGSPEHEVLKQSIVFALSPLRANLEDYAHVHHRIMADAEFNAEAVEDWQSLGDEVVSRSHKDSGLGKLLGGWQFNAAILVFILLNSIQVLAEEVFRHTCKEECGKTCDTKEIDDHIAWLIVDAFFTFVFTIECVLKLTWMKVRYFKDTWNLFDFFLVIMGIFGFIVSLSTHGGEAELAGQTRIIRLARVLRALRFLRIFRLFNAYLSSDKHVSKTLSQHMKRVMCLRAFCAGHISAESDLITYFGGNGKVDDAEERELARCILQSQTAVYQALTDAAKTEKHLGQDVCTKLANLCTRKQVSEHLSSFVLKANAGGALSGTETHAILHPLHHEVSECISRMYDLSEGIVNTGVRKQLSHGHSSKKIHPEHEPITIGVAPKKEDAEAVEIGIAPKAPES